MLRHDELITMATRFDLGQGVELIRLPSTHSGESRARWYVTRGNEYILHRQQGWLPYASVEDGDFFFPDPDSAFEYFLRTGYTAIEEYHDRELASEDFSPEA